MGISFSLLSAVGSVENKRTRTKGREVISLGSTSGHLIASHPSPRTRPSPVTSGNFNTHPSSHGPCQKARRMTFSTRASSQMAALAPGSCTEILLARPPSVEHTPCDDLDFLGDTGNRRGMYPSLFAPADRQLRRCSVLRLAIIDSRDPTYLAGILSSPPPFPIRGVISRLCRATLKERMASKHFSARNDVKGEVGGPLVFQRTMALDGMTRSPVCLIIDVVSTLTTFETFLLTQMLK